MDNIKIRPIPFFLRIVPIAKKKLVFAIAPYIFLPDQQYAEYLSGGMSAQTRGTIAHETVHIKREREQGVLWYGIKYLFLRKFRFQEEVIAITEQMRVWKQHNIVFDVDARAKLLSGPVYVYCVPYSIAKQVLQDIWNKL